MKRIFISPSNQIHNLGLLGYNEAIDQHELGNEVEKKLNLSKEFITKVSDIKKTFQEVTRDSNIFKPDMHLCLHSDASDNKSASGTTIFICGRGGEAEKFANILYRRIAPLSPGKDRGVQVRHDLHELNYTDAPAVLIENFFHTNLKEVLHYSKNKEEYDIQISLALYEYFKVEYPEPEKIEHWAEKYYNELSSKYGIELSQKDFEDTFTRGEAVAFGIKLLKSVENMLEKYQKK